MVTPAPSPSPWAPRPSPPSAASSTPRTRPRDRSTAAGSERTSDRGCTMAVWAPLESVLRATPCFARASGPDDAYRTTGNGARSLL